MPLINELLLIIGAALLAAPLFRRLGLGAILGYLVAGIAIGPFGFGLIKDVNNIVGLSELGVVFLLFIIGLELQPSRLWVLRRSIFGLGGAQMLITTVVIAAIGVTFGLSLAMATIVGFGLSMSSTAFVLQTLAEKDQLTTRHGRESFAVLLFQDLAVIPVLSIIPLLGNNSATHISWLGATETIVTILLIVVGGRFLLGPVLRILVQSKVREIFTAGALFVVLGTAVAMEHVGLSMSLGAFLAGILLADSEYRHELEATIEPFKGLLLGLFFIGVGMSANIHWIDAQPIVVIGLAVGLIVVKAMCAAAIGRLWGAPWSNAQRLGIAISQGGEFAFVLFAQAVKGNLINPDIADLMVMVVTVSLLLSPLVFVLGNKLVEYWSTNDEPAPFDTIVGPGNPVVIAGFGRVGQIVARVLAMHQIPFTAIENNLEQVDFVRRFGSKVYYGDPTNLNILHAAKVGDAKLFVLAIDDVDASIKSAQLIRKHFAHVPIYARARNRFHCYKLMDLGISIIQRDTLLSSLALTQQVLTGLGMESDEAARSVALFEQHDAELLKKQHAIYRDETALIQTSKQARDELGALFETDAAQKS